MALLQVETGPVTGTMPLREVPREKWRDLMVARRDYLAVRITYDCRTLVEYVRDAEVMHRELGFQDADTMIRDGYQLDPDDVAIAVSWLRKHEPTSAVGIDEVLTLARHGRSEDAPRDASGRYRSSETKVDNVNSGKGGNTSTYLRARLRRDRPDLAEKVDAGELSAHAAACEAGFRRRTVSIDAEDPDRAATQLRRVYRGKALDRLREAICSDEDGP